MFAKHIKYDAKGYQFNFLLKNNRQGYSCDKKSSPLMKYTIYDSQLGKSMNCQVQPSKYYFRNDGKYL